MSLGLSDETILSNLDKGNFTEIFVNLGWDYPRSQKEIKIQSKDLDIGIAILVAKMATVGIYQIKLNQNNKKQFTPTEIKSIANGELCKNSTERIMIIPDHSNGTQDWVWAEKKRPGGFTKSTYSYEVGSPDHEICRKLKEIRFGPRKQKYGAFEVLEKVRKSFDTSKVTQKFYTEFEGLREGLESKIKNIPTPTERYWYSILILNRLMFIWFLQKKGFLNRGDQNYLVNCMKSLRKLNRDNTDKSFYKFYRNLLIPLFHDYLGRGEILENNSEIRDIIGEVPYINGGIFAVHQLEENYCIKISDDIFTEIFRVFNRYNWHMGDIDGKNPNDINPDILGYICEQHVNQKETGAYYTKEDITKFMCSRTIAPLLIDRICSQAPDSAQELWQTLRDSPRQYIPPALFYGENENCAQSNFATWDKGRKNWHGKISELSDEDLPGYPDAESKAELHQAMAILEEDTLPGYLDPWLSKKATRCSYRLPGETNREALERIEWAKKLEREIQAGEITDTSKCITLNLEIAQLLIDWLASTKSDTVIKVAWDELKGLRILDPTAGSGAFLRGALDILEDIYEVMLSRGHNIDGVTPSEITTYGIRRTAIINNLYANEINKEAAEICQLRMFLALASCIDDLSTIEPLPDLDLNIKSGNLLVGAESIENAIKLWGHNLTSYKYLNPLREQYDKSIQLHRQFVQAQDNSDVEDSLSIKEEILKLEEKQRNTLDRIALTEKIGKEPSEKELLEWKNSHQPFHWFIEFPQVMQDGGFDIVLGNPPFISKKKAETGNDEIPGYTYSGFKTDDCPDAYAPCMERSARLLKTDGRFAMIAPVSLSSGSKFKIARETLADLIPARWVTCFDIRPSKLFEASVRPIILIGEKNKPKKIYSTLIRRFRKEFRDYLFDATRFCETYLTEKNNLIWLLNGHSEICCFTYNLEQSDMSIKNMIVKNGDGIVGFKKIQNRRFFATYKIDPPRWKDENGKPGTRIETSSNIKWLQFQNLDTSNLVFSFLAGRISHILWASISDGFNVTTSVVTWKPLCNNGFNAVFSKLDHLTHLTSKTQTRKPIITTNKYILGNFDLTECRHITDLSDKLILETLGYPNLQPYILLVDDWLLKSDKNLVDEWPKEWMPTEGPWKYGMPE